jgi:hypothetical protein
MAFCSPLCFQTFVETPVGRDLFTKNALLASGHLRAFSSCLAPRALPYPSLAAPLAPWPLREDAAPVAQLRLVVGQCVALRATPRPGDARTEWPAVIRHIAYHRSGTPVFFVTWLEPATAVLVGAMAASGGAPAATAPPALVPMPLGPAQLAPCAAPACASRCGTPAPFLCYSSACCARTATVVAAAAAAAAATTAATTVSTAAPAASSGDAATLRAAADIVALLSFTAAAAPAAAAVTEDEAADAEVRIMSSALLLIHTIC